MVWIPTTFWKDGGPKFSPFMPKRPQKVSQQVSEEDEQSAVEQNDFPSDLDFEGAHLSTGEANSDDRVAVNNNGKRLGGGQSLAAAKRGKHVPEPHEKNDDDWLYITAEYWKAVAKKGDDALAEIKFPDKFLQQFSAQKDVHNKMKKTAKSSNNSKKLSTDNDNWFGDSDSEDSEQAQDGEGTTGSRPHPGKCYQENEKALLTELKKCGCCGKDFM
ncbi:hypothetical protein BU17DRAFT_66954 [Hysterangium stoloniferum]|nr:hypothetical protein BU17DRAFT_66954 [Hysterangium stoloniferum]